MSVSAAPVYNIVSGSMSMNLLVNIATNAIIDFDVRGSMVASDSNPGLLGTVLTTDGTAFGSPSPAFPNHVMTVANATTSERGTMNFINPLLTGPTTGSIQGVFGSGTLGFPFTDAALLDFIGSTMTFSFLKHSVNDLGNGTALVWYDATALQNGGSGAPPPAGAGAGGGGGGVPEPATWTLFGAGFLGMGTLLRKRQQKG